MDNIREKLVELFDLAARVCNKTNCDKCRYFTEPSCTDQLTVDILIHNGVTVQEWIPVTERLPEKSGEYLTYCGDYDGVCVLYYEVLKTKGKWRTRWKEVTHWMPLPTPPKGE